MKITIIGAGYVGLVTAAIFSDLGNQVTCIDISKERIENLKKFQIPFYEPGLSEVIKKNLAAGNLKFDTSYSASVPTSEVIFICVGTPPAKNGEADLGFLFQALEETAKNINEYALIVIKSTFPIGFEDDLENIVKKHTKAKFEFAACPEFLREGTALEDARNPDRIVIGTSNEKAQKILMDLHSPLPGKRIICDMRSAQLIKYAANSFLATKISFANAIANICELVGADVQKVLAGVGADKRIGSSYLKPGIGYGGSCLPKDVLAFIAQASTFAYNFDLLRSVNSINDFQIHHFVAKVRKALGADEEKRPNLEGFNLGVLGLAFKPNTDDLREAPSIKIIKALQLLGAKISVYDPKVIAIDMSLLENVEFTKNIKGAAQDKDALIILTEWDEFKQMDLASIKSYLKNPIIIDGRNIFDVEKMKELGFKYFSIGR